MLTSILLLFKVLKPYFSVEQVDSIEVGVEDSLAKMFFSQKTLEERKTAEKIFFTYFSLSTLDTKKAPRVTRKFRDYANKFPYPFLAVFTAHFIASFWKDSHSVLFSFQHAVGTWNNWESELIVFETFFIQYTRYGHTFLDNKLSEKWEVYIRILTLPS